jgi:type II secretory pathway pseudopilin PulG
MSLVELLIVLAIVGVLLALILPATQYAREAARRTQCSSNLRQVTLALHQYEATFQVLPAGNQRGYSFLATILPYAEQQPLYARIDWSVPAHLGPSDTLREQVHTFICPSDGVALRTPIAANYSGNMGYDTQTKGFIGAFHAYSTTETALEDRGDYFTLASFTDGLSQTACISEILVGDLAQPARRMKWFTAECFDPGHFDEFIQACLTRQFDTLPDGSPAGSVFRGQPWLEGQAGVTLYTHAVTPNRYSCMNCSMSTFGAFTAASNHSRGVMVSYTDGSNHFVSDEIEVTVWRAMSTRNGGD